MKNRLIVIGAVCFCTLLTTNIAHAHPRVTFGFHFGSPCYHRYYRPWCGGHYIYRPRTIYVERPVYIRRTPVIVQEVPTYVAPPPSPAPRGNIGQPAPVIRPSFTPQQPTSRAVEPPVLAASVREEADVGQLLQMLKAQDERIRSDTAMKLGRLRSDRAVYPLAATLAGDRSALVREAAARALGLIGSQKALATLHYTAQSDKDRDVRRSAQYALEVIQVNR